MGNFDRCHIFFIIFLKFAFEIAHYMLMLTTKSIFQIEIYCVKKFLCRKYAEKIQHPMYYGSHFIDGDSELHSSK